MKTPTRRRWFVVVVFLLFMLLHQSDKLLIGTLTPNIMSTFGITMTEMGAVSTGALIVGAIFYPLWGYLYDRYGRAKLLALASFIWGATTWLNAIAPTFRTFARCSNPFGRRQEWRGSSPGMGGTDCSSNAARISCSAMPLPHSFSNPSSMPGSMFARPSPISGCCTKARA